MQVGTFPWTQLITSMLQDENLRLDAKIIKLNFLQREAALSFVKESQMHSSHNISLSASYMLSYSFQFKPCSRRQFC